MSAYPERLTGKREVRAEHPDRGKSLPSLADICSFALKLNWLLFLQLQELLLFITCNSDALLQRVHCLQRVQTPYWLRYRC